MLAIVVDVIIGVLIMVKAILAMGRGFFRSLVKLCGYFVQLILAILLHKPLAEMLNIKYNINAHITEIVKTWFGTVIQGETSSTPVKGVGIPKGLEDITNEVISKVDPLSAVNARAIAISDLIVNILSFIIIIIVVGLMLSVLASVLDKLCDFPLLRQVNAFAALGLGALDGLLVVCVLLIFISIIVGKSDMPWLINAIDNSFLGSFIQQHNPIMYIISKIMVK